MQVLASKDLINASETRIGVAKKLWPRQNNQSASYRTSKIFPNALSRRISLEKSSIAATSMNGDSYSRGMAPSSSSTKNKHEGESSTDKKPSTDSRGHGSSRDYPVKRTFCRL